MNIVALETTGDVCGIAIRTEGLLRIEITFRHGMRLSERLLDLLDTTLHQAGLTLEAVDRFAVDIGPGSFTGTRMGVMSAKTLAEATGREIVGIDSLEALAAPYAWLMDALILPVLPCRKGVVFAAGFQSGAVAIPAEAWEFDRLFDRLALLENQKILLCGPAVSRNEAVWAAWQARGRDLLMAASDDPHAGIVAALAEARPAQDPVSLLPLYISPPPITLSKNIALPTTEK